MSKCSKTVWMGKPIIITEKSGIRWGKTPTAFNRCVGGNLRGKKTGSRSAQVAAFKAAVAECK